MAGPPLSTPESILIDGANGVTGAPRARFPEAGASAGLALGALVLMAALLRARAPRWCVALLLALAAVPGLWAVAVERADAPARRTDLAARVREGLVDLARLGPGPVATQLEVDDDGDVLFPLGRYVWPARPPGVDGGARVTVELRGASLRTACEAAAPGAPTRCGERR
ncbi:MAG: hypothetical protein INH41_29995 [Myxococcaceae bacterium]|nr:hypothetical protein [Myxococcaceae bacterium]MCA3016637.1 hypothetical protein [Myxococcaceae bacterium]